MPTANEGNAISSQHLRHLVTLIEEASVSRAAHRHGMSQPAMSVMLRQLRVMCNDPLLVRGGGAMVPTERALQLVGHARQILQEIDSLFALPEDFDPATCRKTFTIALPDHILPKMFNGLMREFRAAAPQARLSIRALNADFDFESALTSGTIDLVISNWPTPPEQLMTSHIFDDEFVLLVDRAHPFTRQAPDAAAYLASSHIAPADYAMLHRGVVETYLQQMHLARMRQVEVGYFSMAPYLLAGTDLVFTVTRRFAEHFASILPLAILPSPVVYPRVRFYQLWHQRLQHSPSHRWLRGLVSEMRMYHATSAPSGQIEDPSGAL